MVVSVFGGVARASPPLSSPFVSFPSSARTHRLIISRLVYPFFSLSGCIVQCGGDGYTGPTCCSQGFECEKVADCFSEVRSTYCIHLRRTHSSTHAFFLCFSGHEYFCASCVSGLVCPRGRTLRVTRLCTAVLHIFPKGNTLIDYPAPNQMSRSMRICQPKFVELTADP